MPEFMLRPGEAPNPPPTQAGQPGAGPAPDGTHSDGHVPVATGTELSALDPTFRDRPHEALDDLRQREPVHQDRMFDRVVLTRASDVRAILNDRQMASDPRKSRPGGIVAGIGLVVLKPWPR